MLVLSDFVVPIGGATEVGVLPACDLTGAGNVDDVVIADKTATGVRRDIDGVATRELDDIVFDIDVLRTAICDVDRITATLNNRVVCNRRRPAVVTCSASLDT